MLHPVWVPPVGTVWKLLEHAERPPGSLGAQAGAAALTFLPPANDVSKRPSDGEGEEWHVNSCSRQGESEELSSQVEENCFGKKQAANNL